MVTEYLTAEVSSSTGIHRRLRNVYGEDAIDVTTVRRWVHVLKVVKRTLVTGPTAANQREDMGWPHHN